MIRDGDDAGPSCIVREAGVDDAPAISRLILSVAQHFAEDPAAPTVADFMAGFAPVAMAERLADPRYATWLVGDDPHAVDGVLTMRDRTHLYHLFVAARCHRRGIATRLWTHARRWADADRITVNSTRFAEPVYLRFGFVPTGPVQETRGVRYRPMAWTRSPDRSDGM